MNQVDARFNEFKEGINKAKHAIKTNTEYIINEINKSSKLLLFILSFRASSKEIYARNLKSDIQKLIKKREDLMAKIGKIFSLKYPLTDIEKAEFLAYDYPNFTVELEIITFKVDNENLQKSIKNCIGGCYSQLLNKTFLISNDENYKRYEIELDSYCPVPDFDISKKRFRP